MVIENEWSKFSAIIPCISHDLVQNPIQFDEAFFEGLRIYNRDRLLKGDILIPLEDSDADVINNHDHSVQVNGPRVSGLKIQHNCRYVEYIW